MTPKKITTLLLSVLFAPILFGQMTFEENYSQLGEGTHINQNTDGSILIKGIDFVTKTDIDGNEIWTRQLNDPMDGFNTTSDGGFIKVTSVQINDPFNTHTDIKLIKTDANEQEEWNTQVGDFMSETPRAVMQASDGGYLIAGSTDLIDPTTGIIAFNSVICLIKTDANGIMEWKAQINSGDLEAYANRIIETPNYYTVAGQGFDTNSPAATHIVVMQTSKSGSVTDLHDLGNSNTRYVLNDLAPTNFGTYLIAGSKTNTSNFSAVSEIFVEKRGGQYEWIFCKGEGSNFYNGASWANSVVEDTNGNIFVVGNYSGTGGNSFHSAIEQAALIQLNQEGQEQWNQNYPKNIKDAILTNDGGLAFTGSRDGKVKQVRLTTDKIGTGCSSSIDRFSLIGEYNGSQYFISDDEMTWKKASDLALARGGSLAIIEDQSENDYIQSLIDEQVFIGVSDEVTEGNWTWVNGDPTNFTNLSTCDFCGLNSDENDYGKINNWDGTWSFDNQWVNRRFILEKKCGSSPFITGTCPSDKYFIRNSSPGGVEGSTLEWEFPTATTSCSSGNLIIEQIGGPFLGSFIYELPSSTVTYLIIDDCGNMETCNFQVEVKGGNPCPTQLEGYTYIGATAFKHFFVSNTKSSMNELRNNNLPEYTSLASIQDPGDLYVILNGIDEMVYIGINDADNEGDLVWENGNSVNYTNFDICDFCEDNSDDNDYVIMNHWNGGWSYSSQYANRKHVIELPCDAFFLRPNAITRDDENSTSKDQLNKSNIGVSSIELINLYPNPSENEIFLKIDSRKNTTIRLNIFDITGKNILTESTILYKGLNINKLDISNLNQGGYHIQIINDNEHPILESFIKI